MKTVLLSTLAIGILGISSISTAVSRADRTTPVARVNETPENHDAQKHTFIAQTFWNRKANIPQIMSRF